MLLLNSGLFLVMFKLKLVLTLSKSSASFPIRPAILSTSFLFLVIPFLILSKAELGSNFGSKGSNPFLSVVLINKSN